MGLTKIKLGKYIELYSERCNIPNLKNDDVSGVNREKEFFEPSNQVGKDTSKYKIVPPTYFACNLMHVGRDVVLPIAYNHSEKNKIVSPAYFVFKFKKNVELLSDYFFLFLKSDERDRYFWFNTDSSVRDGMSWDEFINVEIELPSIDIQKKYVAIYKSMLENQKCYERGLEDLKLVCDAYIENLRKKMPCEKIGAYIEENNERNNLYISENVKGVENSNNLVNTKANTNGLDFHNYKLVQKNNFVYNLSRINIGSIALSKNDLCIVSPMYIVFKIVNKSKLLPEYLFMWLTRSEFYRSTLFYASGSVRDTFGFPEMKEITIPIPDIKIQQNIVNIHNAYILRKEMNEKLKSQIKNICPILIKGSIEEATKIKEV